LASKAVYPWLNRATMRARRSGSGFSDSSSASICRRQSSPLLAAKIAQEMQRAQHFRQTHQLRLEGRLGRPAGNRLGKQPARYCDDGQSGESISSP
jgi:hypothetical protein